MKCAKFTRSFHTVVGYTVGCGGSLELTHAVTKQQAQMYSNRFIEIIVRLLRMIKYSFLTIMLLMRCVIQDVNIKSGVWLVTECCNMYNKN